MVMFKKTRLRHALAAGDMKKVRELLEPKIDLDATDEFGRSFLWYAVNNGNREATALLIEKGAAVTATLLHDGTLLHLAARKGSVEIATMLLDKNPALLAVLNKEGDTALHTAARHGYADFAEFMIKKGIDPNERNFSSRTPLALAQAAKQAEVAELLGLYAPVRQRIILPAQAEPAPPPPAPVAPVEGETWKKLPGERIARIAVEETIGYRMTEIFNFAAREKTTLFHNLETKSETVETRGFDELGDRTALEKALSELQKQGGKSDVTSISGLDKKKLAPTP